MNNEVADSAHRGALAMLYPARGWVTQASLAILGAGLYILVCLAYRVLLSTLGRRRYLPFPDEMAH